VISPWPRGRVVLSVTTHDSSATFGARKASIEANLLPGADLDFHNFTVGLAVDHNRNITLPRLQIDGSAEGIIIVPSRDKVGGGNLTVGSNGEGSIQEFSLPNICDASTPVKRPYMLGGYLTV